MRRDWLALVGVGVLAAAGPAAASTTIGADLSTGSAGLDCNDSCAAGFSSTSGTPGTPYDNYGAISVVTGANDGSPAYAPADGVLVSYSVRLSVAHDGRVRVLLPQTPADMQSFSTVSAVTLDGTGDTVSVPGDGVVHTYLTRLPVHAGELIGFEVQSAGPNGDAFLYRTGFSGNRRTRWYTGIPDGTSGPSEVELPVMIAQYQTPLQGVIEPDADHDGFGDETQDKCPGQAGTLNGCPPPVDTDGDGIPDASDACPTQSDLAAPRNPRTGCPAAPAPVDTDGDGIPDASDACPTQSDLAAPRNPRTGCPAPPVKPIDRTKPIISSFVLSPTSFVAANSGPSAVAAASVGGLVFIKLSEPGTVTYTAESKSAGHKSKGRCTRGLARRGQKSCTLLGRVRGSVVRLTPAGLSSFRFMGRLAGRSLKPGGYLLLASARDAAGNVSKPASRSFTVRHP